FDRTQPSLLELRRASVWTQTLLPHRRTLVTQFYALRIILTQITRDLQFLKWRAHMRKRRTTVEQTDRGNAGSTEGGVGMERCNGCGLLRDDAHDAHLYRLAVATKVLRLAHAAGVDDPRTLSASDVTRLFEPDLVTPDREDFAAVEGAHRVQTVKLRVL